jgi:hypothetical protein
MWPAEGRESAKALRSCRGYTHTHICTFFMELKGSNCLFPLHEYVVPHLCGTDGETEAKNGKGPAQSHMVCWCLVS